MDAIALDSAFVAAASIQRVHIAARTRAEAALPSLINGRTVPVSPGIRFTSCRRSSSSTRMRSQEPGSSPGSAKRTVANSGTPTHVTRTRCPRSKACSACMSSPIAPSQIPSHVACVHIKRHPVAAPLISVGWIRRPHSVPRCRSLGRMASGESNKHPSQTLRARDIPNSASG